MAKTLKLPDDMAATTRAPFLPAHPRLHRHVLSHLRPAHQHDLQEEVPAMDLFVKVRLASHVPSAFCRLAFRLDRALPVVELRL